MIEIEELVLISKRVIINIIIIVLVIGLNIFVSIFKIPKNFSTG